MYIPQESRGYEGKPKGAAREGGQETGENLPVMVMAPSGAALALGPPVFATIQKDFGFTPVDVSLVKVR